MEKLSTMPIDKGFRIKGRLLVDVEANIVSFSYL